MKYLSGICSDAGRKKKVNQDAALVRQAETKMGNVVFAVVCDGMGGLEKGELASATVVTGMSEWFEKVFPVLLYHDFTANAIKESLMKVVVRLNDQIWHYGEQHGISLGTTMTALLLVSDAYYICNVGDSRIYCLDNQIRQMTRDQSYIQQEIDMGRLTAEQAMHSSQRNVLLQCIGVSHVVMPDFYFGEYEKPSSFLLCSDGFCHVIKSQEMWETFRPDLLSEKMDIDVRIGELVELAKSREEDDNITAVLIYTGQEEAC